MLLPNAGTWSAKLNIQTHSLIRYYGFLFIYFLIKTFLVQNLYMVLQYWIKIIYLSVNLLKIEIENIVKINLKIENSSGGKFSDFPENLVAFISSKWFCDLLKLSLYF